MVERNMDSKLRLLSGTKVTFHTQLPETMFEHPIPSGIVGVRLYETGRETLDVLNQEIGIWTNPFPGDPVPARLAATLSIDDARSLIPKLLSVLNEIDKNSSTIITIPSSKSPRDYNPDEYPEVRILVEPDVEISSIDVENIEYPYPLGSEERRYNIVISSLSGNGQRIPVLLLDELETKRLAEGLGKALGQFKGRGKGAVKIEEKVRPQRLVYF